MNNRLGDLPDWANEPDSEEEEEQGEGDIESGKKQPRETPEQQLQMQQQQQQDIDKEIFFHAVEQIKGEIEAIQVATLEIEKINEEAQKATTTEKEQALSKKLRKVIDGTNKQAKAAKNLLGELKGENETLKEEGKITNSDLR